ncbi:MAG: DEAD/DEAH box helicase [Phycisphaerales bacterium]|nr:DEAD/DEAH box helicase [Phycisphaerales bacterium]
MMNDNPLVPFTPSSPSHDQQNRGHGQQHGHPVRYEDEREDPRAEPPQQDAPSPPLPLSSSLPLPSLPSTHLALPEAFAKLGVENSLLHSLAGIGFVTPTEIQEKMIPVALTGSDVLGQARTGTGKTAAFGLPILQKLDPAQPFQAIVIVPTRELAVQVEAELRRFGKHKPLIRYALSYGGTKMSGQLKSMRHQPHVVVGTPGRIMDLQERGALPLDNMKFIVCDEVDRMFDIGFRDDIRKILSFCTSPHQTFFVSATISNDIERMVRKFMNNPIRIFTSDKEEQLTNPQAIQYYVGVEPWDKQRALKTLMRKEKPALALIFCRTKRSVDKVAAGLTHDGIAASPIHGDLQQQKRERVMRGFKTGKIHVLVATDLASRGIDVHEITHVVNYDIPEDPEVYVHRVGRTARMGATGRAFTFVSRGQGQLQTEIEKLINNLLQEYRIDGFVPAPQPTTRKPPDEGGHPTQAPAPTTSTTPSQSQPPTPSPQEGYMPTSFANVQPTKSVRPLGGRFPTKRRR